MLPIFPFFRPGLRIGDQPLPHRGKEAKVLFLFVFPALIVRHPLPQPVEQAAIRIALQPIP